MISVIVSSWPGEILAPRACALGFVVDACAEDLLRQYIASQQAD